MKINNNSSMPKKIWITPEVEVISSNNIEGGPHTGTEGQLFPTIPFGNTSVSGAS